MTLSVWKIWPGLQHRACCGRGRWWRGWGARRGASGAPTASCGTGSDEIACNIWLKLKFRIKCNLKRACNIWFIVREPAAVDLFSAKRVKELQMGECAKFDDKSQILFFRSQRVLLQQYISDFWDAADFKGWEEIWPWRLFVQYQTFNGFFLETFPNGNFCD